MRELTRRERAARLMVAVLLVTAVGAVPCAAQEIGSLTLQDVDTTDYPDVRLRVTVPAEMLADGAEPSFVVSENGQGTKVLAVEYLASAAERVDVVLAIDTSGSMKGDSIESAKKAAREFVASLQTGNRVAIVSFSSSAKTVAPFTADATVLNRAIDGLEASGETAAYDALVAATNLARGPDSSLAAIVLLSDGGDTVSRASLDDAARAVRDAGVPVFAVALPSYEADPEALRTLAAQSGGRLVASSDLAGLPALYRGLAEEIQDRFVLVYRSAEPSTKELEIEVTSLGAAGEASTLFVVDNPRFGDLASAAEPPPMPAPADLLSLGAALVMVFGSVALLAAGIALFLVRPRTALSQLQHYEQFQALSGDFPTVDDVDPNGFRSKMVGAVGFVASRRGFTGMVRERLERAGLPLRPTEYISAHLLLVVASGVLVQLITAQVLLAVFTVVVAAFAPILWLDLRASARTQAFEEQLPEVLNLVAGSLRAGWGMLQAIELVVQETLPPASVEFKRAQTEARLGLPIEDALRAMAERTNSDDFRWAVSAIAIQREVGGNLAEVLDIVAATIRDRAALRRHVKALTAEGRLSATILIALPFVEGVVLMLVNPSYMSQLFTTGLGQFMAFGGGVLLVIGALWLRRAMVVEV